jgi:predicted transcriptional regulator
MTAYAYHPQAWERDPVITPGAHGRADVASGKRGRWGRYNDPATLVWVDTLEGRTVGLTRNQANVYGAVKELAGTGQRVTMRALGKRLGIAGSSVYRACIRLAAYSLIAYQSNRGRLGGSVFLLRSTRDGLDWCRDAAKAALRKAWKASEDRISRLRGNVASMFPGRERELYQYSYVTGRNIYGEWTAQDMADAGL